jgi:hypothetical protein
VDVFCEVKGNQIYQIFMSEVPELSRGPFPCPVQAPMLFMYTPDQLICAPAAAVGEPLRSLFQVLDHLSGLDFVKLILAIDFCDVARSYRVQKCKPCADVCHSVNHEVTSHFLCDVSQKPCHRARSDSEGLLVD